MMLDQATVTPFLATTDLDRARSFFERTLGLRVMSLDSFALLLATPGASLRVTLVQELTRAPYTVLGFNVADVRETVARLGAQGVVFNRYPGMDQDELGVWAAPSGALVAWFADPDGNVLSLSQHP